MSLRNLWILCLLCVILIIDDLLPGMNTLKIQFAVIGLVVCIVFAARGLKADENRSEYRWILGLSVGALVALGSLFLAFFLALDDGKFF